VTSCVITYYETTDFLIYLLTIVSYTKWPKKLATCKLQKKRFKSD